MQHPISENRTLCLRNHKAHKVSRAGIALVTAGLFLTSFPLGATVISNFTLNESASPDSDYTASVASIVADGNTFSNFIAPTSYANYVEPGTFGYIRPTSDTDGNNPPSEVDTDNSGSLTQGENFLGNVAVTGIASSNLLEVDLFYDSLITDDNGAGVDSNFEIFLLELGGGDSFTIQGLDAGGSLIGSSTTISAGSGVGPDITRYLTITDSTATSNYGGFALDLSDDLGVSSLQGIRISSNGGDPMVALAVPEPSSLLLMTGGLIVAAGFFKKRRR